MGAGVPHGADHVTMASVWFPLTCTSRGGLAVGVGPTGVFATGGAATGTGKPSVGAAVGVFGFDGAIAIGCGAAGAAGAGTIVGFGVHAGGLDAVFAVATGIAVED